MNLCIRSLTRNRCGVVHFIGIGGVGMSGIAEIMHNQGYKIQGTDISPTSNIARLLSYGIRIFSEHNSENVVGASCIIVSSAISDDNPEVIAARAMHIPVFSRADILAQLTKDKFSIAVSGSHGKTTTTSLIASLFEAAGLDPTVIIGGVINKKLTNAYLGQSDYLILEADESDATFIKISSTVAVVTNIDAEHLDYYKNYESLLNAFRKFITDLPQNGFAVLSIDHGAVRHIARELKGVNTITYGIESHDAHIRAVRIRCSPSFSCFDVLVNILGNENKSHVIKNIRIPVPGYHNILNCLAAISIGIKLGFDTDIIQKGFRQFAGVKRRFTKVGRYKNAEIIDDYAHHPAEVRATLKTARTIADKRNGRVISIFQPHRYTRLARLFDEFSKCFGDADKVFVVDVYSAGEAPIDGVDSSALVEAIVSTSKEAVYIGDLWNISKIVMQNAQKGDLVVMMGAGTISLAAHSVVSDIEKTQVLA